MQVHRNISQLPDFRNAIITIGTFDGVHPGHQSIIDQLKTEAAKVGGETVIITFHPHPRRVVGKDGATLQLLNTLDEKIDLLNASGIDHLVIVPFTQNFAVQSPSAYIEDFLMRYFKPHTIIIGYDHRFGDKRQGDFHLLEAYAKKKYFQLVEIAAKLLEAASISSTRIRNALLAGDIEEATALLGYAYHFDALVVKGNQLGRTLGFPTANLVLTDPEKLVPGNGVYAVTICRNSDPQGQHNVLSGMMNIGIRPTINGTQRVIEVNIFDFDVDIYGESITITVMHKLRAEQKFSGLDALQAQLQKDRVMAIEKLKV
jgi:riboflavin kinase / FMN adenylyltransferase